MKIETSIPTNISPVWISRAPHSKGVVVSSAPYIGDASRKRKLELLDPRKTFIEQLKQSLLTSSIEERGDIIALQEFYAYCQHKFGSGTDLMWYAFLIGAHVPPAAHLLRV
jgi:hypothetical protein